ncbi:MAG: hypothetical protein K9J85_01570 [Desulfobacteraceae bacterium]|nr:hypothetical protein [Desulfobacteraceae bacterium]
MRTQSAVFFPFTFISGQMADACTARFSEVVVYQPAKGVLPEQMAGLERDGKIALRYPVTGDDRRLRDLSRRFLDWAGMHEKAAAAVKKFAEHGFYNQEFAPEIKTEILKGAREPEAAPGPVFNARLFLLLAQEYDRQAAELEAELSRTESAARDLFSRIKGFEQEDTGFSDGLGTSARSPDTGGYMIESRLRAWLYLMDADPEPPMALVTSSPAAVGVMQETFENMEPLERFCEETRKTFPDDGFGMKTYRIPELNRKVCLIARLDKQGKKTEL